MTADAGDRPFAVEFDVTVVNGEEGHRLAALQAEAVLAVVTWCSQHAGSTSAGGPEAAEAAGSDQAAAAGGA